MASQAPQTNGLARRASTSVQAGGQHSLSCTHCRQRKVKCNKIQPCLPCQRLGLECVFPERQRHPKKRGDGTKSTNEELLARLSRMEQLIGKIGGENKAGPQESVHLGTPASVDSGQSPNSNRNDSQTPDRQNLAGPSDGLDRYIGSSFWRSLTSEVEGLRQAVDDESGGEDETTDLSPPDSHSSIMFGSSFNLPQDIHFLHPPTYRITELCDIYASNVDPVFKVMHIPTLRKLVANAASGLKTIPRNNHVEALLFAMYYAATTTLTDAQCQERFSMDRDLLLEKTRAGTEKALSNADFLNTHELQTLQALTIFLVAVRANDDSQFAWTLSATAVRLAQAMGVNRERVGDGISPFNRELRRRLWWQIVVLDIRCCEDRATDPMTSSRIFNTKQPLNVNDADIWPEMTEPPVERIGWTEMTKCTVSYTVSHIKEKFDEVYRFEDGQESGAQMTYEKKLKVLEDIEKTLQEKVLKHCQTQNPIAWAASTVARLIMCRIRLVIYHPIENGLGLSARPNVSRELLLETAVMTLEYSHRLDTEPSAARWRWFFKTYVQWHALATTLVELCVQTEGPLVERAWSIVDIMFDEQAARVADSAQGGLWRPMKKLMSKAQAKRRAVNLIANGTNRQRQQQQQPLPQFASLAFDQQNPTLISPALATPSLAAIIPLVTANPAFDFGEPISFYPLSISKGEDSGEVNWTEWDAFMQDFSPTNEVDMTGMQPEKWW